MGVDVDLGHLTEATDIDFKLLVQAVGFDVELLMEGDDFACEALMEGVGFDSEPLMQGAGVEFEPRLKVDGVGQELITTDVGFVWEPLTVWIAIRSQAFDFEQPLEAVNYVFEPRCIGPRRMFFHGRLLGICAPALALRLLLELSLFFFLHPLLVCKVQPTHLVGLLVLGVVQPF